MKLQHRNNDVFATSFGFRRHRLVLPDGFKRTRKVPPSTLGETQLSETQSATNTWRWTMT
jgi:hypothetical protein